MRSDDRRVRRGDAPAARSRGTRDTGGARGRGGRRADAGCNGGRAHRPLPVAAGGVCAIIRSRFECRKFCRAAPATRTQRCAGSGTNLPRSHVRHHRLPVATIPAPAPRCPAMTAALAHRGPDADGFHFDGPVGLGHRRLSVIDLAGSRQPLVSADGAIAVVFNGEIYNFRAAAPRAAGGGPRLRDQRRRRGAGARLAAMGPRRARPARRHVRVRAVGPRPARALPRPRSPRRQAALLRVARRRARASARS